MDVTLEKLDERVPKVQCGTGSAPVNLSGKRTETVSYTHLDVYKRQLYRSYIRVDVAFVPVSRPDGEGYCGLGISNYCLLYTSMDSLTWASALMEGCRP